MGAALVSLQQRRIGADGEELIDHVLVKAGGAGEDRGEVGNHGGEVVAWPRSRAILVRRAEQVGDLGAEIRSSAGEPDATMVRVVPVGHPVQVLRC
jgi:hypothetical protein